ALEPGHSHLVHRVSVRSFVMNCCGFSKLLGCLLMVGALSITLASFYGADKKPAQENGTKEVAGADWPLFRGNPLQTCVPASPSPDKRDVLWQLKAGDAIEAPAAIANGVVYVGSFDEHLYAIDLATGQQKWKYKAGPIKAAIAVRDGAVYVGNLDGVFHCVDAAKGTKRWAYKVESGADIPSQAHFVGGSVLFGCSAQ